jgi:hypothetical protein
MKLWTIHPTIVWELLNKQGCYYGVKDFVYDDEMFLSAYDWMKKQLVIKTGIYKEHYPVWAWYKRPDLRYSGHLSKGTKGVLIECEINEGDVLLSDFELWHYVLNYWYLPMSMKDMHKFEKELKSKRLSYYKQKPLPEPYNKTIEDSWQRIFNLDWYKKNIADKKIQAVFWELKLDQAKKVKEFVAK